jgi:hypothetical protein
LRRRLLIELVRSDRACVKPAPQARTRFLIGAINATRKE